DAWHQFISDAMDAACQGNVGDPFDSPRSQFFNAATVVPGPDIAIEDVKWTAFPRLVQITSGSDMERWLNADAARDVQDEYCEWSVTRQSGTNKITRVTFTCEGPEYWRFLAATDPARTLALYKKHIDESATQSDLFTPSGAYLPRNRFNNSTVNGAMHLVQRNNTLRAEIEIAGAATIRRLRANGTPMTDALELIQCGRYGAPQRHSDPFIGARVNFHARNRADITVANPVGIYFAGLDTQEWETPDGSDPAPFWRYTRGVSDRPVRAVIEVPSDRGYVLGDVHIDGRQIQFGGQIADRIQMTIRALATRIGLSPAEPVRGCVGDAAGPAAGLAAGAPLSVSDALGDGAPRRI
ncbi:MAG: hypothetical protein ACRDUX_07740, partial [Mycobacterium sp.]